MKAVSQDFKNAIKTLGREIDAKITYISGSEEIELSGDDLNSITPHYEGGILKSVMKQLDIDSNIDIPLGTILEAQFGVLVDDEYEYISFGNYVVYSSEKQEDTKSYKIICYDKMLYSMKDYEDMNITYPISVRSYIDVLCNHLGLTFANSGNEFVNYDQMIPNELFLDAQGNSLDYTFRDVLDQLAEITASTICINDNDALEIRYINEGSEPPTPPTGDYQEVEYIQSSGTQYIDTGINVGENTKVVMDFQQVSKIGTYPKLFGSENDHNNQSFKVDIRNLLVFNYYNAEYEPRLSVYNDRHTISLKKGECILDNNRYTFTPNGTAINNYNIYLSTCNRGGSALEYSAVKIYSCQIYNGDTLVRDFMPCYRISDDEIGLLDKVNNMFYPNAGSGVFTKGNDVNETETIEETETESETETIDEEYLKDVNVNFGEQYGPVNTITFKRSADADAISKSYPQDLPDDEKIEIAISDNQFLNSDDREDFIDAILYKLKGLTYHLNDYVSTGITYLDLCDKYDVVVDDTTYSCVMLNDEIEITQGLVENIHTERPEDSTTDYNTTSKDDRTKNRTTLIVDKQNQTITALATRTAQLEQSIEVLSADLDTNVIVIPVDGSNVPFTTKTYEINYSVKYLGSPLSSGYTISTSDTHTGITTDITTLGKLKFSVSSSTAISSVDNKYTFTISYVVGSDTFTLTRSVMLSLISSDAEQSVVISDTAPLDTNLLWLDSTTDELKRYIDGEWILVNDFSSDISSINANLNTLNRTIQDNYNTLNGAINNLSQSVSTQFQQTTDSFTASITQVSNDINNKDTATNERINDIQSYLSYALEEVYNPITGATATTGVVSIGKANNTIKLKEANDILFFEVNGVNVGYLGTDSAGNSKIYFVDAQIVNSIRLGSYEFIPRANGSLSFRKVS